MKKTVLLLLLLTMPVLAMAGDRMTQRRINNVINSFRGDENFEVVKVGRMGISFIKMAGNIFDMVNDDADSQEAHEVREAMKLLNGIRKVYVVDYECIDQKRKTQFDRKLNIILAGQAKLIEISDEDERMVIYGKVSEVGTDIENLIVHVEGETLICIFGTFSMEQVIKLAKMNG